MWRSVCAVFGVAISPLGACGGKTLESGLARETDSQRRLAESTDSMRGAQRPTSPASDTSSSATEADASGVYESDSCAALRRLDANEVYMVGTLQEGLCGREAVAHWSQPNVALVGFDCD